MNKPLVSVIIPCYNAEKYVEEAIRSIMTQTYPNLEIIVTDDCSSDNTLMILETLAAEDSRIQVIKNKENLKIVKSLNNMIEVAQGKYIARMDADDISLPERIEKQVNFMEENPEYGLCGTNAWIIDENGRIQGRRLLPENNNEIAFFMAFFSPVYHPSILCVAKLLKENLYSEDFPIAEDYELWFRLQRVKNVKFYNIQKNLLKYRKNRLQSSKTQNLSQIESSKKILKKYKEDAELDSHIRLMYPTQETIRKTDLNYINTVVKCISQQKYKYSYYVFIKILYRLLNERRYFICIRICLSKLGLYCCMKKIIG